ncbi:AMP-binding protein [Myxococcota bacterium]|nr:AMP-binding protein [Myxococcota bacterium]
MIESDDPRLTFGRFLEDLVASHSERAAIVFEGRTWTYAEFDREVRLLARGLMGSGVVKGSRVGILMSNRFEFAVCAFAIEMVGAVLVPVNTFANPEETDYILRHGDVSVLLMQDRLLRHEYLDGLLASHPEIESGIPGRLRVPSLPQLRRVFSLNLEEPRGGVETWSDLIAHGADVADELLTAACAEVESSDDGIIIYTSGTTANPKGVLHAQRSAVLQGRRFSELLRYEADDRVYTAYPFFWGAGLAMSLCGTLASGACLLLDEIFEPGSALKIMSEHGATALHAWVHQQSAIAEHPNAASTDLSKLIKVESSGPLGDLLGAKEDVYGVGSSYGLSETFTLASMLPADTSADIRHATSGRPLPGMVIRVVDPETGHPLPTGESGEIIVKGVTFMRGYYKVQPESYLDDEGFFHTADEGTLDEEGYLHFTGRLSNVIKTGGANVSPLEIERCVAGCPGVHDGVAVGMPHPLLGEVVVLGVSRNEGAEVDPEEVRSYLRARLSAYKIPKLVLVFEDDELQYTATQKVQVAPFREAVVQRIEREALEIEGHRYGVTAP